MRRDNRVIGGLTWTWLTLWAIQPQFHSVSAMAIWTAYVELDYVIPGINQTMTDMCECGVYGYNSPAAQVSGLTVLPNFDPLACHPNTTFIAEKDPWIALIKRGNCSYTKKIQVAKEAGASAVVIYNLDETGNKTIQMPLSGSGNIVAIMIGNILGTDIKELIESGTEVSMSISVANRHMPLNALWLYVLCFAFIFVTTFILGYFLSLVLRRLYRNRQHQVQKRKMKKVAQKAIAKLQIRTLRRTDPEVGAEESSCAVCLDSFMRCDVVTTLPCSHLFHKTCVEPWLLEHHTCPMCKHDILMQQVVQTPNKDSPIPRTDFRFYVNSVSGLMVNSEGGVTYPVQHQGTRLNTQTAKSAIEHHRNRMDHTYTNATFQEE